MKSWRSSLHRAVAFAALCMVAVAVACSAGTSATGVPSAADASADAQLGPGLDAASPQAETSAPVPGDAGPADAPPTDVTPPPPPPPNLAPAPTLTSIAPAQAVVSTPGPTIACVGKGFVARSVVQVNGVPLKTTFVSATELHATIPDANMSPVGTLNVSVGTAPPGGGGSAELPFEVVNPSPTITALSPTSALLGSAATLLTVTGSSFVAGATIAFNGTTLATTVSGPTTATATIPASALVTSGVNPVTVTNPTPGGGTSPSIAFIVSNPSVAVISVTPSTLTVSGPATPLAITGSGFVATSAVSFNGTAIPTTFTSSTQLAATVPASSLLRPGSFPVAVTNPPPGGGVSAPVTVSVVYPPATATSLSPSSVALGAAPPTVVMTGSGFLAGVTTLTFDGAPAATTVLDSAHVQATLTTAQMGAAHTFQVIAVNPAPGGGSSSPLPFSVTDPVPTTTSVSPSSVLVGAPDTTVTVRGNGFVPASLVLAGTTALATTYVSTKTLTAVLPAASLAATGTISLAVSNPAPGGGTSTPALSFNVTDPVPTATSVSPSFAAVGAPDTKVTVTGSRFVAASTVLLGTTPLVTTFVSSTALSAVIPASSLAAAATLSLSVSTPPPGGGTSGALGFTVDNPGPTITTVSPSSVMAPAAATPITVTGTGFLTGVSVLAVGGTPLATTYSGGALGATLPAADLASATTLSVTVSNPAPGGGSSNVSFFTVNDPVPTLTSVAPTQLYALSGDTPITLTGTGFVAGSIVHVNGAPATVTARTSTSLTATVPAALLAPPGTLSVTVTNPAPGGGTTAAVTINVVCNIPASSVVLSALSTPATMTLNYAGAPSAYLITRSQVNDFCPSNDDTTGSSPYLSYVVVNATSQQATLSAWAVCGPTDDAFLTFYQGSTPPTTQSQLESCTGYVAEGKAGAGGHNSPQAGASSFCPGLTKAGGDGLSLAACATAVVLIQPYSTTAASYTPPTTLTIELQ